MSVSGRHWVDGWTVSTVVTLLLSAQPPTRLSAQVSVQPSIGLRYTSTLVHDSIVAPFDVRPALAPAIALTVTAPLEQRWSAQASLDFATSTLERHDAAGATTGLGRVSTIALTVGVRRQLPTGLAAGANIGGLKYLPAQEAGIFRTGTGGVLAVGGVTLSYTPASAIAGRWRLGVEVHYDVHRFITPALRTEGFTSGRVVHRVALMLQAGRKVP